MIDRLANMAVHLAVASVASGASSLIGPEVLPVFGVPLGVVLAGFAGATLALSLLPKMSLKRALIAVALGTFAAAFGTPVFAALTVSAIPSMAGIPHQPAAFFIGLGAQLALSWLFKRAPEILDKKTGVGGGGE